MMLHYLISPLSTSQYFTATVVTVNQYKPLFAVKMCTDIIRSYKQTATELRRICRTQGKIF